MNDRKLHDEIVTSVLESVTGVTIDKVKPSTKLRDLDPTMDPVVIGMNLQRVAARRGIVIDRDLLQLIREATPGTLTISNLRKMAAAAWGDEDFDIPWPPKKR